MKCGRELYVMYMEVHHDIKNHDLFGDGQLLLLNQKFCDLLVHIKLICSR